MRDCIFLLFVLFISNSHCDLIIKPGDQYLTRDQYKSFVASCTGQPNTRVASWRSPQQMDVQENNAARVTVERQTYGLRLRIRNLTVEDQGAWECVGADIDGTPRSRTFQMNIKVPITFHGDPIQYAALGEQVIIKCRVLANPPAEVSWFKGPDKTRIIAPHYERTNDGLKINKVDLVDNDIFWCQADVLETGESRDYPITVIISQPIKSTRITCSSPCAVEKKTAMLICEAAGSPPPKYQWFYGTDSPVISNGISKYMVYGNTLTINYVDETDNGKYTCHAYNEYDRQGQKVEYMINVVVPPRILPIPPVEINLDDRPQQATFQCRIDRGTAESLSLEWQFMDHTPVAPLNGIYIDASQLQYNKLIELRFNPVRREHFGNYSCVAKNLADTTHAIARLYVKYQPVYIGPTISVVFSVPNYRAIMRCLFDSYPPPKIQWVRLIRTIPDPDGRILTQEVDPEVIDIKESQVGPTRYESVLTYNPAERDFGLSFECRAVNPRVGRHTFLLQRAEPPRMVRITEAKPLSTAVEIIVQPPDTGGLPLMHYVVKYEPVGSPHLSKTQTFPAETVNDLPQVLRIENLLPSIAYRMNIYGESRAGSGQLQSPIQFKTLDRQVPQFKIVSNDVSCLNDKTCLIKWTVESDGGSPISKGEIVYAKAKGESGLEIVGSFIGPIAIDPLLSEYEIQNLDSDTFYIISLKLYNEAGAAEQKIRKLTTRSRIGAAIPTPKRPRTPSKWVIIAIVVSIITVAFIVLAIIILNRSEICRCKRPENSAYQGEPLVKTILMKHRER